MTEIKNSKQYDLENRTFEFAKKVRDFVKKLSKEATELMMIFSSIMRKSN